MWWSHCGSVPCGFFFMSQKGTSLGSLLCSHSQPVLHQCFHPRDCGEVTLSSFLGCFTVAEFPKKGGSKKKNKKKTTPKPDFPIFILTKAQHIIIPSSPGQTLN